MISFLDVIGLLLAGFMVCIFIYYNIITHLDMDIPYIDDDDWDIE